RFSRCGTFADQFDIETTFLLGFAQSRRFRIFVEFNVAAQRQPLAQLAMMNDKDGDSKIDRVVQMRHEPSVIGSFTIRIRFSGSFGSVSTPPVRRVEIPRTRRGGFPTAQTRRLES